MLETSMAAILTSLLLVVALSSSASTSMTLTRRGNALQAAEWASLLMTEISEKCFQDPASASLTLGPESGETLANRISWDDVDDFNGLALNPLSDRAGSALPNSTGWRGTVSVAYAVVTQPDTVSSVATALKRVRIDLTDPSGRVHTFTSLRSASGAALASAPAGTAIQTSVDLRFNAAGRTWTSSGRLNNQQAVGASGTTP